MSAIMRLMAIKLGLKDENIVLSKASEFERLLKIKITNGTNQINDYARAIICLDIATDCVGMPFDTESGIKLSALKKSLYANAKHNIKKILDLETGVNINSLCIQLGCTNVAALANTFLDKFKTSNIKKCDLDHPQYTCMAVYQACRVEKVKVTKNKFITQSRLKPSQWNELEAEWSRMVNVFVSDMGINVDSKKQAKDGSIAQKICNSIAEKCNNEAPQEETKSEKNEDYESWKKRILEAAYRELGKMDTDDNAQIKKNANEHTPVKIDREKGVRLIFKI